MENNQVQYENSLQLSDILMFFWQWKFKIFFGSFLCTCLTAVVVYWYIPDTYRASMSIQPAELAVTAEGVKIYVDTAVNIKEMISAKGLNEDIKTFIQERGENRIYGKLKIQARIPRFSEIINISYDTTNPSQGLDIIREIPRLVEARYKGKIELQKRLYLIKIAENQNLTKLFEDRLNSLKSSILNRQNLIQKKNEAFKKSQQKFEDQLFAYEVEGNLKEKGHNLIREKVADNEVLSYFFWRDEVRELIGIRNQILRQMNENEEHYYSTIAIHSNKINELRKKSEECEKEIFQLRSEIKDAELRRSFLRAVNVIKAPTITSSPIKPNRKKMIIAAFISSFLLLSCLFGVIEYATRKLKIGSVES